ncbi:MAG: family N-acetyltransferase [Acidobacteria bacterium]|nr:family N-acetyltransferase [Acidobacteriota bacterium]
MLEIRQVSRDRWQDYRQIRLEALQSDPVAFSSSFEEEAAFTPEIWQSRTQNTILALIDERPAGMVSFVLSNRPKTGHIANIYGMFVSGEFRRQGIGAKLLSAAIARIQENPEVRKIKLTVVVDQQAAVNMYRKFGFLETGRSKDELCVDGRFFDEIQMEKLLYQ